MKQIIKNIIYHIVRPPAYLILTIFTCHFFYFLWRADLGIKEYPKEFTLVYLFTLVCISLSNLLRRSRWFN